MAQRRFAREARRKEWVMEERTHGRVREKREEEKRPPVRK